MSRIGLESEIGREKIFAGPNEYQGICVTCNDAPFCARLAHHGQAVWYCEEFTDYVPSVPKMGGQEMDFIKEEKYNVTMGICGDCRDSKTCAMAISGKPTWQCEEYS